MTDSTQTTGLTGLPRTIAEYLTAHRTRDADTAITCFTDDAAVTDDGKTCYGIADIRAWLDRSAGEYTYTTELTGAEKIDDEHYTAINHLEGDSPAASSTCTTGSPSATGASPAWSSRLSGMSPQLGTFGAWFNPSYDDDTRVRFVAEAEALGFGAAWLGLGRRMLPDLTLVERALDATAMIVVATAIVNMWTNDAASIAASYKRIEAKHPGRFMLGVGIGHPESVTQFRSPYDTMVSYLDELDAAVPAGRRVLAALGDRALRLARDRAAGCRARVIWPARPLGSGPITGHSQLLRAVPALCPAVLCPHGGRRLGWSFSRPRNRHHRLSAGIETTGSPVPRQRLRRAHATFTAGTAKALAGLSSLTVASGS